MIGRPGQHRIPTKTDGSGVRRNQAGWERVHICVGDATRLAYVEVLPDEKANTAVGFLSRAGHQALAHPALPAPDQRQGRALIRTMLSEWAYAAVYGSSPTVAALSLLAR